MEKKKRVSKIIVAIGTFCLMLSTKAKARIPKYLDPPYDPGEVVPRIPSIEEGFLKITRVTRKLLIIPGILLFGIVMLLLQKKPKHWQKIVHILGDLLTIISAFEIILGMINFLLIILVGMEPKL